VVATSKQTMMKATILEARAHWNELAESHEWPGISGTRDEEGAKSYIAATRADFFNTLDRL
jgi:hypothetical protein